MNIAIPFSLSVCFILNPFVAFCFSLYLLAKQKYVSICSFICICFAGLFGYTFFPASNMDITRHYVTYDDLTNIVSFSDFIFYESLVEKPDFLIDLVYWLVGKIIDTHQVIGFLGASLYYGLMFGVIKHCCSLFTNNKRQTYNFFLFLLLSFLSLTIIYDFSVMRQGNAILLFLFIITIPSYRISELKRVLLLLLPCLLHFSLYPIVFLYLCTYILKRRTIFMLFVCMILCYFFFPIIMHTAMNVCNSVGGPFAGVAEKIDLYMFNGKLSVLLFSGSRIRFVLTIFLFIFIFPILVYLIEKKSTNIFSNSLLSRFHYFSILFAGYLIMSSSTYILSRNLVLFKFIIGIYLMNVVFTLPLKEYLKNFLLGVTVGIWLLGIVSFYHGRDYRCINTTLFYSNIFNILAVKTNPAGYSYTFN